MNKKIKLENNVTNMDICEKEVNIQYANGNTDIIKININKKIIDLRDEISKKTGILKYNINIFSIYNEIQMKLNDNINESEYLLIIEDILKFKMDDSSLYNYYININNYSADIINNNNNMLLPITIDNINLNISYINKYLSGFEKIKSKLIKKNQSICEHEYEVEYDIYDKLYTCIKCNFIK